MTRAATLVEVYKARKGWRFRAKSRNNKVIGQGQAYTRKHDAARGAVRAFPHAEIIYLEESP